MPQVDYFRVVLFGIEDGDRPDWSSGKHIGGAVGLDLRGKRVRPRSLEISDELAVGAVREELGEGKELFDRISLEIEAPHPAGLDGIPALLWKHPRVHHVRLAVQAAQSDVEPGAFGGLEFAVEDLGCRVSASEPQNLGRNLVSGFFVGSRDLVLCGSSLIGERAGDLKGGIGLVFVAATAR